MVYGQYTIADNKHAKELIKLGFSERLLCDPDYCERIINHCKKYNMKFLKGSYGTIVHNDFDKYFKTSKSRTVRKRLENSKIPYNSPVECANLMDHTNLLHSVLHPEVYILTSSPYGILNEYRIKSINSYPYNVYVLNPNLLDYHVFEHNYCKHPLKEINFAFTDATDDQMDGINYEIQKESGIYEAFVKIKLANNKEEE